MITIESLTKRYGSFTAVDDVTITAAPGRVTGFLGPNGAGKSTTMRALVGLTEPTSGTARILGRRFAELPNPGREVGVLLDASAQHAGRTGREILTVAQRTIGLPAASVDRILHRVSLTDDEAGRRVANYSLGMRQRLGIATALIGDPEVLILDEPANGLDPAGIRWMRDLLRDFANEGGTVLLSSHLLHEIEVIADDIVVIGNGRIVAEGTKTDLLASGGSLVRAADPAALARALDDAGISADAGLGRRPAERRRPAHPGYDGACRRRTPHRAAGRRRRRARGDVPDPDRCQPARPPGRRPGRQPRRSGSMSATAATLPVTVERSRRTAPAPIPASRLLSVELRKMFDTRSGFWLMASIVILSVIATAATITFAPRDELTYETFASAVGIPMSVILPVIAVLSVTSEWSQRSALTTFTLVPSRGRVILAKAVGVVLIGIVSIGIAAAVGALGNVVGTAIAGVDTTWNVGAGELGLIVLANVLSMLVGFMLGVVIRSSAGAIVAYFVYGLVLPGVSSALASTQDWYRDNAGWLDFNYAVSGLFNGSMTGEQWSQLGVTTFVWLVLPLTIGLRILLRSEVK